ncbi:DUF4397 domain-containing protein [Gemmatimonas sp.]|uniref:DUF4397 domain-containing protein n=1 Tax=Gemmatimonas sp. TaxID=1962908 RepID=UPI00356AAAC1
MRTPAKTLLLLSLASGFTACKGDSDADKNAVETTTADGSLASPSAEVAERRDVSMVRMINALPSAKDASVSADDIAMFSGIGFKTVTPYTELKGNVTKFRLQAGDRDTTIASNNEIMMDGSRYSLVALPDGDGHVRLRVLKDELATDSTKARLRVIHGVKGAGEVDVVMAGMTEPFFDNVNLTSEAGYKNIDPVKTIVSVNMNSNGKQILKREMDFKAGHSYSVVLTGTAGQRIEAIVIDDEAISNAKMMMMDSLKKAP